VALVGVCEELRDDAGFGYYVSIVGNGGDEATLLRMLVFSFFVDAFFSKVLPSFFASIRAADDAERDAAAEQHAQA
jgi:hypothetical protein